MEPFPQVRCASFRDWGAPVLRTPLALLGLGVREELLSGLRSSKTAKCSLLKLMEESKSGNFSFTIDEDLRRSGVAEGIVTVALMRYWAARYVLPYHRNCQDQALSERRRWVWLGELLYSAKLAGQPAAPRRKTTQARST